MATFHIVNFGCRATQADAAAIERQLLDRGYAAAGSPEAAEVVVVNTCTVTASADTQALQAIRSIHRENPGANILVTGCYAQRAPEDLASLDGVRWVVGNSYRMEIPRLLEETRRGASGNNSALFPLSQLIQDSMSLERGPAKILTGNIFEQMEITAAPVLGSEAGHTRPVLKIQDGCDNRCSYCVIPFVRGRSRSLPPAQVAAEIRRLAGAGAREIVLSGINLGSYGRELVPHVEFGDLLRRILDETSLERLRISSIEPIDLTRDLIELFAASDRLAPHFHVPLQSGSDRILAAMHRWYRTSHYARHIELIRELLPDAGVGADVIAGFPGETEVDHQATLALIERLPFTYLHVFSFSPRPGTKAAGLLSEVPLDVIQRRARELRALSAAKSASFRRMQMGKRLRVLTLHRSGGESDGTWTGAIAGNYLSVRVTGTWPANQWLDVEMASVDETHAIGSVFAEPTM